jgi:hypothetical protein
LNWKNIGCPTLALFARVGIRDLGGLGMLVVGICDFPPIEMHDGWGSLKEVVEEGKVGQPAPSSAVPPRAIEIRALVCACELWG